MIRPLKAVYSTRDRFNVYDHRNDSLVKNVKIPENFCDKLFSHPITAFGYNITQETTIKQNIPNIKFSKHDVIRALDFWIEHWVYQNQCDYILTNTVNVDFEITLKELILVREKIMKMPADTMFTRHKIRAPFVDTSMGANNFNYIQPDPNGGKKYYHYDGDDDRVITNMTAEEIRTAEQNLYRKFPVKGHYKKQKTMPVKWEESEAVIGDGTGSNSIDPFCYRVIVRTQKQVSKTLEDLPSNMGQAFQALGQTLANATTHAGEAMNIMAEEFARMARQQAPIGTRIADVLANNSVSSIPGGEWTTISTPSDPHNWRVAQSASDPPTWRVVDSNGRNIAIAFRSIDEAQGFINHNINQNSMVSVDPERVLNDLQDTINLAGTLPVVTETVNVEGLNNNNNRPIVPGEILFRDENNSIVRLDDNRITRLQVSVRRQGVPSANVMGFELSPPSATTSFEVTDSNGRVRRVNGPISNPITLELSDTVFQIPERGEFTMQEVPITAQSITVQDDTESDEIVYEGLFVGVGGFTLADPNSFITVPVEFSGGRNGRTRIHTNVFFNSDDSLAFARSMQNHTVRILPRRSDEGHHEIFQIDGEWHHIVDVSISHDPAESMNGFIFKNLFVEESEATRSTIHNTLRLDFGGTEGLITYNVSVILLNPPESARSMRNNVGPWEVEILGDNRVRIGEEVFITAMPIDINIH